MLKISKRTKLEIGAESLLPQAMKKHRSGTSFSIATKITFMLLAAVVFLSTGVAAIAGFTPQAHAIKVDPISDMLCPTVSNGTSYLGGISQPIINGFEGVTGDEPWKGLFGVWTVPKADQENIRLGNPVQHEWTTLERYGYYGTEYTNWIGMQTHYPLERILDEVFSDGKLPFMGTGGNPGGFGSFMYILNGTNSPLFSQSLLDCIPIASHATVAAANTIQALNQSFTAVTLNFYSMSSNLSLSDDNSMLRPLGKVLEVLIAGDGNTKGLKDLLFLEFMLPLIMGGAILIFLRYIRTWSMLKVLQQVLWILFIAVLGMILLSKPLIISSTVDKVVNSVTGVLSEAVLGGGERTPECKLSAGEPQKVERELSCYLWMQNVYSFWVQGQFGVSYEEGLKMTKDPAEKAGVAEYGPADDADTYVGLNASNWAGINKSSFSAAETTEDGTTKTGSKNFLALTSLGYDPKTYYPDYESMFNNSKPVGGEQRADGTRGVFANFNPHLGKRKGVSELKNWPYYQMDTTATWPVSNGYNHSEIAYNQLAINNNLYWKHPADSAFQSLVSLGYTAIPNVITFLFSLTLITLQVSLTLLIVLAPFFLALGLIPGFGARIFYKWVNMLTGITMRRILVTFFFFLYMKLYFIILNSGMELMTKLLIILMLSLVIFNLRESITTAIVKGLQIGKGDDMSTYERDQYAAALAAGSGAMQVVRRIRSEHRKDENREYETARRAAAQRRRARRREDRESKNYYDTYYEEYRNAHNTDEAASAGASNMPGGVRRRGKKPTTAVSVGGAEVAGLAASGGGVAALTAGGISNSQPHASSTQPATGPAALEGGSGSNKQSSLGVGESSSRLALEASAREEEYKKYGFQDPRTRAIYQNPGTAPKVAEEDFKTALLRSRAQLAHLTNEEKLALSLYTTSAYRAINDHMYGKESTFPSTERASWDSLPGYSESSLHQAIEKQLAAAGPEADRENVIERAISRYAAEVGAGFYSADKKTKDEYLKVLKRAQDKITAVNTDEEILFRGVNIKNLGVDSAEEYLSQISNGDSMSISGQSSSSSNPRVATQWAMHRGNLVFEIKTSKASPLTSISDAPFEMETLVSPGDYKIVGTHLVEQADGRKLAVVQMVEE